MKERILITKTVVVSFAFFIGIVMLTCCSSDNTKTGNLKSVGIFQFLGEGYDNGVFRPENFGQDVDVTSENIVALYGKYNVDTLFNGDYYLVRSKKSYTSSRYLSRLIQMKDGKQAAAKTFYDSEIDANAVIRLKNRIIVGLNSLRHRKNNYKFTPDMSTHKCRIVVLSDSLTPIEGRRFYSKRGHTYIESLMQNSDSTFFCSVASGDVELDPKARYQFRARYNFKIDRDLPITNYYDYEIKSEGLDLSKPDWGNDLSDEEIADARIEAIKRERKDSLHRIELLPEPDETLKVKVDSSAPIIIIKESVVKEETSKVPEVKVLTKKERFNNARKTNNWNDMRQLADEGYSPAYIPLANHYLKRASTHHLADKYAQKAKKLGISDADKIIQKLKDYDYY